MNIMPLEDTTHLYVYIPMISRNTTVEKLELRRW